jgi:hypothetical protein
MDKTGDSGLAVNETLRGFVEAVERIRQQRSSLPDAQERRAIARDVGLSEADLDAAQAHGERQRVMGEGFVRHKLWDEAIRALGEAEVLLPEQIRVLQPLAEAHLQRWRARGEEGDRKRAEGLAKRCLTLDPGHEPSFALLRSLETPTAPSRRRLRPWLVLVAAAAAALAMTLVLGGRRRAPVGASPGGSRSASPCPDGTRFCTLPLELALAATEPGLSIKLADAHLNVFGDELRLGAGGTAAHQGPGELELLRLGLRLFDAAGKQLEQVAVDAQAGFRPSLRPGDSVPFYVSQVVAQRPVRGEIVVLERKIVPAPAAYGTPSPMVVLLPPTAPSHFKLRCEARAREARSFGDKSSADLIVAVRNDGEGVVRKLELKLVPVDGTGRELGPTYGRTVAYQHMPPMSPGESRVEKLSYYVTGRVAEERLVVTVIQ